MTVKKASEELGLGVKFITLKMEYILFLSINLSCIIFANKIRTYQKIIKYLKLCFLIPEAIKYMMDNKIYLDTSHLSLSDYEVSVKNDLYNFIFSNVRFDSEGCYIKSVSSITKRKVAGWDPAYRLRLLGVK